MYKTGIETVVEYGMRINGEMYYLDQAEIDKLKETTTKTYPTTFEGQDLLISEKDLARLDRCCQ